MSTITTYQIPTPEEQSDTQIPEDDRDNLQEIHELINLIYIRLPHMPPVNDED